MQTVVFGQQTGAVPAATPPEVLGADPAVASITNPLGAELLTIDPGPLPGIGAMS